MGDQISTKPIKMTPRWLTWSSWLFAISLVLVAAYLAWFLWYQPMVAAKTAQAAPVAMPTQRVDVKDVMVKLPDFLVVPISQGIYRKPDLRTIVPTRPRQEVKDYTVEVGDSVFAVARSFGIKPETVLWANYDLLNDNPDYLAPGMQLKVPPVDGVLYLWQEGDNLEGIAAKFKAKVNDILDWPGNRLDLTDPEITPGTYVMVPGGEREFRQWLIPTIPRGVAGVSRNVLGAGACPGGYDGAYGSGFFIWPAYNHTLSGNDYWSGHLGIDIAASMGDHIYAADSGVVVFAGGAFGGYGLMVMIDHGNGYQTLYAHLSQVNTRCGSSVYQGQLIGLAGSTGKSTGPHLHFEVRYLGGFVNPWYVLPAP